MIFNELIENVEQMELKNRKKVVLEVSLDLRIYIYIVYSYRTFYLIILINSLLLNTHSLTMILRFLTQLFSTQRRGFLPLLVKTMIYLKLSEILTLARPMVLMIYQSEWSSCVMIPLLNLYQQYSRIVLNLVCFLIVEKNQTLSQFIRKMTNNQ